MRPSDLIIQQRLNQSMSGARGSVPQRLGTPHGVVGEAHPVPVLVQPRQHVKRVQREEPAVVELVREHLRDRSRARDLAVVETVPLEVLPEGVAEGDAVGLHPGGGEQALGGEYGHLAVVLPGEDRVPLAESGVGPDHNKARASDGNDTASVVLVGRPFMLSGDGSWQGGRAGGGWVRVRRKRGSLGEKHEVRERLGDDVKKNYVVCN